MYDAYLTKLVEDRELPGGVLHIQHKGVSVFEKAYGSYLNLHEQEQTITKDTVFDVASLTKVMVTLPSILKLVEQQKLSLDDPIKAYIPAFKHKDVTIHHALTHTTGLPADLGRIKRDEPQDILQLIIEKDLIEEPGTKTEYSDLAMILLGDVIERVSGMKLEDFATKNLLQPWGLTNTTFHPKNPTNIASTEKVNGTYVQGEVHDEKAYHLGGAGGSAGLFSTAKDVARFGHVWLYPQKQNVLSPALMKKAATHSFNNRGLGFEVWSGEGKELSCGRRWSEGSFGHTGFTGTSLWVDQQEELVVALVTNVVHYGRNHNMRQIRPTLHSLIHESLI
ncbi:serine hydrolase domain-containing protein [Pontibacillus yanchengensis]|uniref:Penicillin-binding protein n=1 Tax=Pontibacillus yanchengensis Y32 TaxID=1385514 RepID=A0A0A2TFL0_9BACI|nr:serine hydrolase domain-containing protein [Pontibacillus yanchengensis]KGP74647.1 penicillin-binding protein [Pontibacillus yanchengensis Y32]